MMVNSVSDGMVGGMVGSYEAVAMVSFRFTFSIPVHSQQTVVVVAMQALGAPVGVADPGGVDTQGGVEVTVGQRQEEEEEENCHG